MSDERSLSREQIEQIVLFESLLQHWNRKINIVSRADIGRIRDKHVRQSGWFCHPAVIGDAHVIMDMGSGGGFPGIPMKIFLPGLSMTLLESKRKKALFLREVIDRLALTDTRVVCERAESLRDKEPSSEYDMIVCRAVAPLDALWSWSEPLLKPGGRMAALKGGDLTEEFIGLRNKNVDSTTKIIDIKTMIDESADHSKRMILISKQ